ncbi:hypothetical protein QRO11_03670 [Paracidovorax citrulli]|uniref:hypothetical protein n=1 Tax=Paracidovorax citrulli TaxID=80869 RepID=UPI00088865AA|nr:hypothetical protein [Paracidovorax citrulli]WIY35450.1 hypothetical protein QRO11_03670 [Paracidovorax citrulli]SDJ07759.1 hypothetical protein SAMN04489709_101169 [Paracidovorax citrulli]
MANRLLIALILALALIGAGYRWGHKAADNAWAARKARDDEAAQKALDAETRRADTATSTYLQDHRDQADRYDALDLRYQALLKRTPLVVYRPAPAGAAGAVSSPAAPAPAAPSGGVPLPAPPDAAVPHLTLAAVRVWNGALTSTDAPAGACGATAATEGAGPACAEDSGLTLDDAWANHRANARSCADDRQRYRALIDFIQSTPESRPQ